MRLRVGGTGREDVKAAAPSAPRHDRGDLIRARRSAMGSYFEICLGAGVPGAVELADRALNVIDVLEAQLSIYRDDSEVSRLNATAHDRAVPVEAALFDLICRAVEISRATAGAYDVTSGALSEAWGFVRGPKRIPDPETLADARSRTGRHHLTLDPRARTVAFDRPGVTLNFGSIGKGHAIDRAVAVIRNHWWPTSALVHGGQSSLYAAGSPPGYFGDRWEISLRNPFDPANPLGTIRLRNRGLGTSGAAFQNFVVDGQVYGHILDPRTGRPGQGPASVTVLAPTAAEADALSTAFYLLGYELTENSLRHHPEVGVIFVDEDVQGLPRVRTIGLNEDDFTAEESALN
jgi:thiamine biosynthesis lipoprotein